MVAFSADDPNGSRPFAISRKWELAIVKTILTTFAGCIVLFVGLAQVQAQAPVKIYPKTNAVAIQTDNPANNSTGADMRLAPAIRRTDRMRYRIWVDNKHTEGWISNNDVYDAHQAIAGFPGLIAAAPNEPHNYYWRGAANLELGHLQDALDDFTHLIQLTKTADPTRRAMAYTGRAMVWCAMNRFDSAILDCNEAIRIDGACALACYFRGVANSGKEEFDAAISDFASAISRDSLLAIACDARGMAYARKKMFEDAMADYTRAIQIDPHLDLARAHLADAYNQRGFTQEKNQQWDKAIADYTRAIQIDPNFAEALHGRGRAKLKKQEYVTAIVDLNDAIRAARGLATPYPHFAEVCSDCGSAYAQNRQYRMAIDTLDEAIRRNPNLADAWNHLAWLYATCADPNFRNPREAVNSALRARDITQLKNDKYLATLAAAYAESGQFPEAVVWLQAAMTVNPKNDKALRNEMMQLFKQQSPYHETR